MMQLKVEKGGEYVDLDLFADSQIAFELENPIFKDDVGASVVALPFSLPQSPHNKVQLDFTEHIESDVEGGLQLPAIFYHSGMPIFEGLLKVEESIFTASYNCTLVSPDISDFTDKLITDLSWTDISMGADTKAVETYAKAANDGDYTTHPVAFPVMYNEAFTEHEDYQNVINPVSNPDKTLLVNANLDGRRQWCKVVAYPYLFTVLDKIAEDTDFVIDGDFMTDTELQTLIILNNFCQENIDANGTDNWEKTLTLQNNLPDITIGALFTALKYAFSLVFNYARQQKRLTLSFTKDIVTDTTFVDWTAKVVRKYSTKYNLVNVKKKLCMQEDGMEPKRPEAVPDDFLYEIPSLCSRSDSNEKIQVGFYAPRQKFVGNAVTNPFPPNQIYNYQYMAVYGDTLISPTTAGEKSKNLGLAFFRGLHPDSTKNFAYALGGRIWDSWDSSPAQWIGDYTLYWYGTQGGNFFDPLVVPGSYTITNPLQESTLESRFLKPFADLLSSNKVLTRYVQLTATDVFNIDWLKKVRIEEQVRTVEYLVKKISVTFRLNNIAPAKVEFYKVR